MYYFDNASTTKIDNDVLKEMNDDLKLYANPSSIHSFGRQVKQEIHRSRIGIANTLNCKPHQIFFTSGGTEGNNLIIKGAIQKLKNTKEDYKKYNIITSKIEHPSVLECFKDLDIETKYIDVDEYGIIDIEQLRNSINEYTLLVSIMYANNEIGTIQPIQSIGKIIKNINPNTIFHTDAVQAFCKLDIDIQRDKIDALTISGHKIHALKGIGCVFLNNPNDFIPQIVGGGQENDFRSGTLNTTGITSLRRAIYYMNFPYNQNNNILPIPTMNSLKQYIIDELLKIKDSRINGSLDHRLCNNISVSFKDIESESLLLQLDNEDIYVSAGSACNSLSVEPSHVLKAINVPEEYIYGTIRISLSKYTTKDECEYLIQKINECVNRLRGR